MSVPRIEDAETVEVGRVYDVALATLKQGVGVWWLRGGEVPLFGTLHEDREIIGFADTHWHIDWRFLAERWFRRIEKIALRHVPCKGVAAELFAKVLSEKNVASVRRGKRRCRRPASVFPTRYYSSIGNVYSVRWMEPLEAAHAGAVMRCGKCPHRGLSLAGAPEVDGALVCPGHGLAWDKATGRLRRRSTMPLLDGEVRH